MVSREATLASVSIWTKRIIGPILTVFSIFNLVNSVVIHILMERLIHTVTLFFFILVKILPNSSSRDSNART